MTEQTSAESLRSLFGDSALGNYMRDGFVAPVIAFIGPDGIIVQLAENEDVPMTMARVAMAATRATKARYIVTVAEAWSREHPADVDINQVRRGDLQRAHDAGDEDVITVITVTVYDVEDHHGTRSRIIYVDREKTPIDMEGENEGRMNEMMRQAIHASDLAPEGEVEILSELLVETKVANAVLKLN